MAQMPEYVIKIVPADGDDMTWNEDMLSRDTAIASESALAKVWADDYDDNPLTYPALVRMVHRLQDEMHAYAEQLVATRAELAETNAQVVETQRSILRILDLQEKHAINTVGTAQNLQAVRAELRAELAELREKVEAWEADS